ncbi:MAG: serine/threonine-protein kinase [Planctomycetota bacterium]|nr:serine/threonine-protein kinase [Planctomycetota bacterium]
MSVAQLRFGEQQLAVEGEMILGRSPDCALQLQAEGVSRQHAKVCLAAGGSVQLEDLGSSNGTRVNGRKIPGPVRLRDGDTILLGRAEIHFSQPSAASDTDSAPVSAISDTTRIRAIRQPESLVGELVGGYRIGEMLGKGRFGATYRARQLSLDRNVALTAFWTGIGADDPGAADGLLQKIRNASAISDPSIAQLHECGRDADLLWCTAEFVDGDDLAQLMNRESQLPIELALLVAERTARGLLAAHEQGVVHGDVRPGTIKVTRSGNVKLMDLGIAAIRRAIVGASAVSASQRAPELEEGDAPTISSDVYALGCTLFQLLTGRPPYAAKNAVTLHAAHRDQAIPVASDVRGDLPAELDELVHGMLAKRPEWRFAGMDELVDDLARLREGAVNGSLKPKRKSEHVASPAAKVRAAPDTRRPTESRTATRRSRRKQPPWVLLAVLIGVGIAIWQLLPMMRNAFANAEPGFLPPASGPVIDAPPSAGADTASTGDNGSSDGDSSSSDGDGDSNGSDSSSDSDGQSDDAPAPDSGDPLRERWAELQIEVTAASNKQDWRGAERLLRSFQREAEGTAGSTLGAVAASQLRTLRIDAERWYQQALRDLPPATDDQLRERLIALDSIRRQVAQANRTEADTRYQQAAEGLRRRLAQARHEAVMALEAGDMKRLPTIASNAASAVAGTPLEAEFQRFAAAANEAAKLRWQGDWTSTRVGLSDATGSDALAAAGAMLLVGDQAGAAQLLLGRGELSRPPLGARRNALLAATATVITFDDPADLGQVSVGLGEVSLADGDLTGTAGDAVGMQARASLGSSFECELNLNLSPTDEEGAASVAIVTDAGQAMAFNFTARPGTREIVAIGGGKQGRVLASDFHDVRLRIRAVNGSLWAWVGTRQVLSEAPVTIANEAKLTIDIAGMDWRLREIKILGGG